MKKFVLILGILLLSVKLFSQTNAIDCYCLSRDASFQQKSQMLMLKTACTIVGEDTLTYSNKEVEKRHELAILVLRDPITYGDYFARIAAAQTTLDDESTDAEIEAVIRLIWDKIAGIKWTDALTH